MFHDAAAAQLWNSFVSKEMCRMLRTQVAMGFLILIGAVAALAGAASADDEKLPTIKEIMKKANNQKTGLLGKLKTNLAKPDPDWSVISKDSSALVVLAEALVKDEPRKGDQKSWARLTAAYLKSAKELSDASEKKDLEKAQTAQKALSSSCTNCHRAHK
jgi:hypothetical protein